jgi:hypothetical protein
VMAVFKNRWQQYHHTTTCSWLSCVSLPDFFFAAHLSTFSGELRLDTLAECLRKEVQKIPRVHCNYFMLTLLM